jgi:hypothetical protein
VLRACYQAVSLTCLPAWVSQSRWCILLRADASSYFWRDTACTTSLCTPAAPPLLPPPCRIIFVRPFYNYQTILGFPSASLLPLPLGPLPLLKPPTFCMVSSQEVASNSPRLGPCFATIDLRTVSSTSSVDVRQKMYARSPMLSDSVWKTSCITTNPHVR